MKQTLLEIVRDILNDMDSDDVNSLQDTVEALQVAQIVKTCYFEMIGNRNWPHLRRLTQLEHSGDTERPTHLRVPDNIKELVFFRYDKTNDEENKIEYADVKYKHPDEFLRLTSSRNSTTNNVRTVTDYSGVPLIIIDNRAPMYWTSFDDEYMVCDSYDKTLDDTLKKSKTQALMYINPVWVHTEDAVPDLPVEAFPALIAEAKSTSFLAVKQMANEKAEQKAVRQQRWLSRKAWKAHGGVRYDNYGRTSRK